MALEEYKPEHGGDVYLVGGYDGLLDSLRTWRFSADPYGPGIVGMPYDRDIATVLAERGYEDERAITVADAVIATLVVTDLSNK